MNKNRTVEATIAILAVILATALMSVIHDTITPQVNIPYTSDLAQSAVFWFGDVSPTNNYADVRMSYNDTRIIGHVAVIDRLLWYAPDPTRTPLTAFDSVSLYLYPGNAVYRFDAQLTWYEERLEWQSSYRDGIETSLPFTTTAVWRGDVPNNDSDDRGYFIQFDIPFSSLGITPSEGDRWKLAVVVHDRDDLQGTHTTDQSWPNGFVEGDTSTWGKLSFGMNQIRTNYDLPVTQTITITSSQDAMVGGSSVCGEGLDFWSEWGNTNYNSEYFANVQNQVDIADWPCFSKYYLSFPVEIPEDTVIRSAKIQLYLFGNAGIGYDPPAFRSFIQVFGTSPEWEETTITWNNAPLARQNYGGVWVYPLDEYPGPQGVLYEWNVTTAVMSGETSFVFYSGDLPQHSGRYFWGSEFYLESARPKLVIEVGERGMYRAYFPVGFSGQ
jgi:hypothetical protein